MSSSTLQFLVAGALIAAWAWMLGRPILTNLFRRSRRDSVGHFRYQQAVLGRPLDEDPFSRRSVIQTVLQPLRDWRGQPLERRRLQVMLGFSFATFFSLLTAIAFRGSAIRLFLIMVVCFAAYLGYAAYVGAAQIRRQQQPRARRARPASVAGEREQSVRKTAADETTVSYADYVDEFDFIDEPYQTEVAATYETDAAFEDGVRLTGSQAVEEVPVEEEYELVAEVDDPFDGSTGFGTGDFEDGFFEPIPELQFAPLNLDASVIKPTEELETDIAAESDVELVASSDIETEIEIENEIESDSGRYQADHGVQAEVEQGLVSDVADIEVVTVDSADGTEPADGHDQTDATPAFTAPPRQRQRPARKKARPIYIESVLDEVDDQQRVVND